MRFRFTLFLLAANLVVFGLIWNNARRRNVDPPRPELVFPTDPDRIVVATGDPATSYVLARDATRWSLDKPYRWPANEWAVRKLLDQLRFISRSGGFSLDAARRQGDASAKIYGLDKPVCTLTVSAAGRDVTVKIGEHTLDGTSSYMLANDGDTILPAPNTLLASLLQPPESIRREEVFSIDNYEVTSVNVATPEKGAGIRARLVRARRDLRGGDFKSVWAFEIPVTSDADTPLVNNELAALVSLKYRRFFEVTPELLRKTRLAEPDFTLTLDGNNRSQTLLVGARDTDEKSPYRFAKLKDNPVIFTIPEGALERWRELPVSMRDPKLLRPDDATLAGIAIRIDGIPLVMHPADVRSPEDKGAAKDAPAREWQMPVVPGGNVRSATPVDPEVFGALYRSLAGLSARNIQPPSGATPETAALCRAFVTDNPTPDQLRAWGLDNPKWRVELSFAGRDKPRVLSIAPPVAPGTPHHAMTDDSPTVFSIGGAIVAPPLADRPGVLSVSPETYRRRLLFAMRPGDTLTGFSIRDLATGKTYEENKPADIADWKTWLADRPATKRAEIDAFVRTVAELRARSFLEKPYAEDFKYDAGDGSAPEPWRYRIEWKVKPAGADASQLDTHVLLVTRRLGGATQLGGLANADAVFTLPQEWVDALAPLTFGRDDSVDVPKPAEPAKPDAAPAAK